MANRTAHILNLNCISGLNLRYTLPPLSTSQTHVSVSSDVLCCLLLQGLFPCQFSPFLGTLPNPFLHPNACRNFCSHFRSRLKWDFSVLTTQHFSWFVSLSGMITWLISSPLLPEAISSTKTKSMSLLNHHYVLYTPHRAQPKCGTQYIFAA